MAYKTHFLTLEDTLIPAKPRHLAYYEWGDTLNPRTIICLHGLSRNGRDFELLAERLSEHYRVISPDMAGRGKSNWLNDATGYNYGTYYNDTLALLKALNLTRITFIGTSMGGIISMMIAAGNPAMAERIILNDVGSIVSAKGLKRILAYVGSNPAFNTEQEAMQALRRSMASFGIKEETHWQFLFDISFIKLNDGRYAVIYDPTITASLKTTEEVKDVDLTSFWNQIHCPVLILRGKNSDILEHETALRMCTRTEPTQLVEWEGIGHAPSLLENMQIETIINWLDNKA